MRPRNHGSPGRPPSPAAAGKSSSRSLAYHHPMLERHEQLLRLQPQPLVDLVEGLPAAEIDREEVHGLHSLHAEGAVQDAVDIAELKVHAERPPVPPGAADE